MKPEDIPDGPTRQPLSIGRWEMDDPNPRVIRHIGGPNTVEEYLNGGSFYPRFGIDLNLNFSDLFLQEAERVHERVLQIVRAEEKKKIDSLVLQIYMK